MAAWTTEASKAAPWGTEALPRLLSLTQRRVVQAAEAMASRGAADAVREIAGIAPSLVPSRARATVDSRLIGSIVMGLGDRILSVPVNVKPGDHAKANAWQAQRILDTEAFAAYNRSRLAVELALLETGTTFEAPTRQRDAKDWIFGIAVRWDARLDRRTCPICSALHGTVRPLGAAFDGGPIPPKHARCRCCAQFWPIAIPKR